MKNSKVLLLILIIGVAASLGLVLHRTLLQQNASVATLSGFFVKGSIFVDTNGNGKKDTTEVNYTGTTKPLIRLALFAHVCSPKPTLPTATITPSTMPAMSPTPTLAPHCYYSLCPQVACIYQDGKVICPVCKPTCITGAPVISVTGAVRPIVQGGSTMTVKGAEVSPAQQAFSSGDIQQADSCAEKPVSVIDCPVNPDGTYSCVTNDIAFSRATLTFNQPSGYDLTTHNSITKFTASKYQKDPSATIDFGIVPEGTITPPVGCFYRACDIACSVNNPNCCPRVLVCSTPTVTPVPTRPVCIPRPACLNIHQCTFPTPPGGWCSPTGKPLTNDETSKLLIYLNTLLRGQLKK